jgi:hypothetical protein
VQEAAQRGDSLLHAHLDTAAAALSWHPAGTTCCAPFSSFKSCNMHTARPPCAHAPFTVALLHVFGLPDLNSHCMH